MAAEAAAPRRRSSPSAGARSTLPRRSPVSLTDPATCSSDPNGEPIRADRRPRARPGREGLDRIGSAPARARTRPRARSAGLRVAHRPRRRHPAVDRLRRLRRPDPLARDRRGQRHRQPAAPAPRHARSTIPRLDAMSATPAEQHVAAATTILVDGAELDEELPRPDRARSRSSTTCACPTCARSRIAVPEGRARQRSTASPFEHRQASSRSGSARASELTPQTAVQGRDRRRSSRRSAPAACALLVRAYDRVARCCTAAARSARSRTRPSSDIVTKVVERARPQRPSATRAATPHDFVQQNNETDWEFIWRLAERIDFEFVVEDQTASLPQAGPPTARSSSSGRRRCRSFRPRVTGVQQVDEVTSARQDPKTKQAIEAQRHRRPSRSRRSAIDRQTRRGRVRRRPTMHVADRPVKTPGGGHDALAQALLDQLANGYIAAEGVGAGQPEDQGRREGEDRRRRQHVQRHLPRRRPRRTSTAAAAATRPRFAERAARTRILGAIGIGARRRSRASALSSCSASSPTTTTPTSIGRVRVQYPALGDDTEGSWARIATPSAGNERGAADAARSSATRCSSASSTATRAGPTCSARCSTAATRPATTCCTDKDGSFALLSRPEDPRRTRRRTSTIKTDEDLIDRDRRKAEEKVKRRLHDRGDRQRQLKAQQSTIERPERERQGQVVGDRRGARRRSPSSAAASQIQVSGAGDTSAAR